MYPFEDLSVFKFSELVVRLDYDSNDRVIYRAIAIKGSIASDPHWKINRYTYGPNGKIILIESALGSWNDRTTLTYL